MLALPVLAWSSSCVSLLSSGMASAGTIGSSKSFLPHIPALLVETLHIEQIPMQVLDLLRRMSGPWTQPIDVLAQRQESRPLLREGCESEMSAVGLRVQGNVPPVGVELPYQAWVGAEGVRGGESDWRRRCASSRRRRGRWGGRLRH